MLFSDEKINFDKEDDNEFDEDSLHMSPIIKDFFSRFRIICKISKLS